MKKAKKAFSLVELAVVISVIIILSVMVLVGVTNARKGEGVKADYLEFYDALQSLKLRANLGRQNGTFTKQVLTFTIGGSSYTINGATQNFKNRSRITKVNTTTTASTVTISFVPQGTDYQGPTPLAGKFAAIGGTGITSSAAITIQGPLSTDPSYIITINGAGYFINEIDRQ